MPSRPSTASERGRDAAEWEEADENLRSMANMSALPSHFVVVMQSNRFQFVLDGSCGHLIRPLASRSSLATKPGPT